MSRTDDVVIAQIKELIEEQVKPAVAGHGGVIEYLSFNDGLLMVELGGACSGCSSSTVTLKLGVEQMIMHYVPEVLSVEATDGVSDVEPYYQDYGSSMMDYHNDGLDYE